MARTTRWETEALRTRRGRPRPGSGGSRIEPTATRSDRVGVPDAPVGEPETMLVPLDAWNRMLNQLGNLHEAGQQLADARERAARAETEVTFLRERLAELRSRLPLDEPWQHSSVEPTDPAPPEPPDGRGTASTIVARSGSLARSLYSSWRSRR